MVSPYAMIDPEEYYWMMEAYNEEIDETQRYIGSVLPRMEYNGEGEGDWLSPAEFQMLLGSR